MQSSARPSLLLDLLGSLPHREISTQNTSSRFAACRVTELRELCRSLGLRTSRPKAELIAMLEKFYAEHDGPDRNKQPSLDTSSSSQEADSSVEIVRVAQARGDNHQTILLEDNTDEEIEPLQEALGTLEISSLGRRPSSRTSGHSEPMSPDFSNLEPVHLYSHEANKLDKILCDAICQDQQLYRRILLLEPIPLDEFIGLAKRHKITTRSAAKDRAAMRTWLDTQGICFYEGDLGN